VGPCKKKFGDYYGGAGDGVQEPRTHKCGRVNRDVEVVFKNLKHANVFIEH
jgi:hypothetical protein